jgi:hypothetical protein
MVGSVGGNVIPGIIELEATVKYGYFIRFESDASRPGFVLPRPGPASRRPSPAQCSSCFAPLPGFTREIPTTTPLAARLIRDSLPASA